MPRKGIVLMKFLLVLAVIAAALCSPVAAHNYAAPALYLAGLYSPIGEPVKYPVATDAEMAWILKQLETGTPTVRGIAAGALGQTNNPKAVESLIALLQDEDPWVQVNASFGFFHIKDPRALEPLKKLRNGPDGRWQMGVFNALAAQGDSGIDVLVEAIAPKTERALDDPYEGIAEAVILSKGSEAIPWAADTLKGTVSKRYLVALYVLSALHSETPGDRVESAVRDAAVTERLISLAKEHPSFQGVVAYLLRGSQDPRVLQMKKAAAKEQDEQRREVRREVPPPPVVLDAKAIKRYAAKLRKVRQTTKYGEKYEAEDAAGQLGRSSSPAAVGVLIKILNEKNPAAARLAAMGLESNRSPESKKALVLVLANPKHPAFKEAVSSLIFFLYLGDKDIARRLLQSKDDYVVRQMMMALHGSKSDTRDYLVSMLKNPKHHAEAAMVLAERTDPVALDTLVGMLKDDVSSDGVGVTELCRSLARYGKPATDKVLARLHDRDPRMREGAAWYFSTSKEPRAVDPLIAALGDQYVRVRRQAIRALVFQNDRRAASSYVKALTDSDPAVRKTACHAIAYTPDPNAKSALVGLLNDEQEFTRTCAGLALAQIGDARGADAVGRAFSRDDRSSELLLPAIRAAGKLNYKQATGEIIGLLGADIMMSVTEGRSEEEMAASRAAKLEALKSLTGQDFGWAFYRWMAWWVAQGHTPDWRL